MFITVRSKVNECTFRQILHYSGKKHLCWNFWWSSFPLTPSSLSCKWTCWRLLISGEHIFIIKTQSDCSFYQRITLKLFQLCRRNTLFDINCIMNGNMTDFSCYDIHHVRLVFCHQHVYVYMVWKSHDEINDQFLNLKINQIFKTLITLYIHNVIETVFFCTVSGCFGQKKLKKWTRPSGNSQNPDCTRLTHAVQSDSLNRKFIRT